MKALTSRIGSGQRPEGRSPKTVAGSWQPGEVEEEELVARAFEETLWNDYGLKGVIVPDELLKECQIRLRNSDPASNSRWETEEELQFLDQLHQYRKRYSTSFARLHPKGIWENAKKVAPSESMRSKGKHLWALIIGNDRYQSLPLGGCVNDAHLVEKFIITYLNVPRGHIRLLENADRDTITNALYDLRDNKGIQPGDNILIHFSGHGSSYDASDYFITLPTRAGSMEALCPIDRGLVPDISERELNSILSEIQAAKGSNITVFLDCCHSGGALRALGDTVRFIPPVPGHQPLREMLEAADMHPRRHPSSPTMTSEIWTADISSFVMLAACQDFQLAEEFNIPSSSMPSGFKKPSNFPKRSSEIDSDDWQARGRITSPIAGPGGITARSPRHGRFTWALIKILESDMGINATYASVINSIGRLGPMQVPVAVGLRKGSNLWFEQ